MIRWDRDAVHARKRPLGRDIERALVHRDRCFDRVREVRHAGRDPSAHRLSRAVIVKRHFGLDPAIRNVVPPKLVVQRVRRPGAGRLPAHPVSAQDPQMPGGVGRDLAEPHSRSSIAEKVFERLVAKQLRRWWWFPVRRLDRARPRVDRTRRRAHGVRRQVAGRIRKHADE